MKCVSIQCKQLLLCNLIEQRTNIARNTDANHPRAKQFYHYKHLKLW